jgi:hypothetical protein
MVLNRSSPRIPSNQHPLERILSPPLLLSVSVRNQLMHASMSLQNLSVAACGDGRLDVGEECDPPGGYCSSSCTLIAVTSSAHFSRSTSTAAARQTSRTGISSSSSGGSWTASAVTSAVFTYFWNQTSSSVGGPQGSTWSNITNFSSAMYTPPMPSTAAMKTTSLPPKFSTGRSSSSMGTTKAAELVDPMVIPREHVCMQDFRSN